MYSDQKEHVLNCEVKNAPWFSFFRQMSLTQIVPFFAALQIIGDVFFSFGGKISAKR